MRLRPASPPALAAALAAMTAPALAQDCFIGEVRLFAGNFAPRGYSMADGSLLAIAQNPALFAVLGTTYGGDGRSTFALPDLRGRAPIGAGGGPGLTNRPLGAQLGGETATLTPQQLPAHTHAATTVSTLSAATTAANSSGPNGATLANPGAIDIYNRDAPSVTLNARSVASTTTVAPAGGGAPVPIMPPSTAINYVVCVAGLFPSR